MKIPYEAIMNVYHDSCKDVGRNMIDIANEHVEPLRIKTGKKYVLTSLHTELMIKAHRAGFIAGFLTGMNITVQISNEQK